MSTEVSDNDLSGQAEAMIERVEGNNPLYALQQAIAVMPPVDADKVAAAISKLESGALDILCTEAERLACEQRIAQRILEETCASTQKKPA